MALHEVMREPVKVVKTAGKVVLTMSPAKFSFLTHYIGYTYLAGATIVLVGGTYLAIRAGVPILSALERTMKGGK